MTRPSPSVTKAAVAGAARRLPRIALGLALAVGTGACSDLIPGTGPAPNLYNLTPKSSFRADLPEVEWQLVVEEPLAAGGLDTNRIALRPSETELKYFAGVRWVERAPRMIQTLLVESFENTGRIVAVGRQAIGLRSDFNLKSELREFQAEYTGGRGVPVIRVRLNAKIVRQPRLVIIASRNFERTVAAEGNSMRAIVAAFDRALDKVLRQAVEWTLTHAG